MLPHGFKMPAFRSRDQMMTGIHYYQTKKIHLFILLWKIYWRTMFMVEYFKADLQAFQNGIRQGLHSIKQN